MTNRTATLVAALVALLTAGCNRTEPVPAVVDDSAHLQALLSPFVADPSSKVETLPGGMTRAVSEGASMVIRQDGKRIVAVAVKASHTSRIGFEPISPMMDLVGRAQWQAWKRATPSPQSTTIGEWTVDMPGDASGYEVHARR